MEPNGFATDRDKWTKLQDHTTAGTGTVTSDELDMFGFDGVEFVTSFGTGAAGNLVTVHGSNTSGGEAATVALKATAVSTPDVLVDVQHPAQRYMKLVATRGTSSTLESIWARQYRARNLPTTQDASLASAQFDAPALA